MHSGPYNTPGCAGWTRDEPGYGRVCARVKLWCGGVAHTLVNSGSPDRVQKLVHRTNRAFCLWAFSPSTWTTLVQHSCLSHNDACPRAVPRLAPREETNASYENDVAEQTGKRKNTVHTECEQRRWHRGTVAHVIADRTVPSMQDVLPIDPGRRLPVPWPVAGPRTKARIPPHPGPRTQDPALHKHNTKCKHISFNSSRR